MKHSDRTGQTHLSTVCQAELRSKSAQGKCVFWKGVWESLDPVLSIWQGGDRLLTSWAYNDRGGRRPRLEERFGLSDTRAVIQEGVARVARGNVLGEPVERSLHAFTARSFSVATHSEA